MKIRNNEVDINEEVTVQLISPNRISRNMNNNSFKFPSSNPTTRKEYIPENHRCLEDLVHCSDLHGSIDSFDSLLATR